MSKNLFWVILLVLYQIMEKLLLFYLKEYYLEKEGERRIREDLIQNDLIDTIFLFQAVYYINTNIPFVIVILNKAKKYSNIIKLVNAEPFVSKPSSEESFIDIKELCESIS